MDLPQENIDLIMGNLSNYYDLRNLKMTSKVFNKSISLPKIAEKQRSVITMNVSNVEYGSEVQDTFGHSKPQKYKINFAPPRLSEGSTETNYATFKFYAPCKKSQCEFSVKFIFGENKICIRSKTLLREIVATENELTMYINQLLKLYHRSNKNSNNNLFVVYKNNVLDVIVTDYKLNYPSIVRIQ